MRDRQLQHHIREVLVTLDDLIKVLEGFRAPEVPTAKMWKSILASTPSTDEINDVWQQMQHIGAHMGYMDYAHPTYDAIVDRLLDQMAEVVTIARRRH